MLLRLLFFCRRGRNIPSRSKALNGNGKTSVICYIYILSFIITKLNYFDILCLAESMNSL